jgi:hypothetical protein
MSLRPILLGLACWACAGCVRAGGFDGTACQANGGFRCCDLTSMKQQPGGPPIAPDDARTLADERPSNPPPGPVMNQMRPGVYQFYGGGSVYVVTPGPVQQPGPH